MCKKANPAFLLKSKQGMDFWAEGVGAEASWKDHFLKVVEHSG